MPHGRTQPACGRQQLSTEKPAPTLLPPAVKAALWMGMSSTNQLCTRGFLREQAGGRHALKPHSAAQRTAARQAHERHGQQRPVDMGLLTTQQQPAQRHWWAAGSCSHLTPSTEKRRRRRSSPADSSSSPPAWNSTLLRTAHVGNRAATSSKGLRRATCGSAGWPAGAKEAGSTAVQAPQQQPVETGAS